MTSLKAFAEYQRQNAWTWEHQALVRARVVAGSDSLAEKFSQLRGDILGGERDKAALREEVVKMRQKMRDHLAVKPPAIPLTSNTMRAVWWISSFSANTRC